MMASSMPPASRPNAPPNTPQRKRPNEESLVINQPVHVVFGGESLEEFDLMLKISFYKLAGYARVERTAGDIRQDVNVIGLHRSKPRSFDSGFPCWRRRMGALPRSG